MDIKPHKKGKKFWIERCKDERGELFIIHRFKYKNDFTDSLPIAEGRDYLSVLTAWNNLEYLK